MIRFYEFKDADGTPGMNGQRLFGSTARDTVDSEINAANKHLLHHARVYGLRDVLAYHPSTPLPTIMKRANEIRAMKGMDPIYDDEDIKKADPKYQRSITIHAYDVNGSLVPYSTTLGPEHLGVTMAKPIIGAPIAPDDPAHPLLRNAPAPAAEAVAAPSPILVPK